MLHPAGIIFLLRRVDPAEPPGAFTGVVDVEWVPTSRWTAPTPSCTSTPGLGSPRPATSALGLGSPLQHLHRDWGSPLPHLRQDWAHRCNICTATGLTPPTSSPGLGSPCPHLRRDWAHPCHICTRTQVPLSWTEAAPSPVTVDWVSPPRDLLLVRPDCAVGIPVIINASSALGRGTVRFFVEVRANRHAAARLHVELSIVD
jgi:hypothetical protein